ncbi:MAG: isopenicillin N synthase family oxygenase [Hyphomicrobiales bacterium]|nr:isopenicillin N synthase family oxygenase [Hyphomicrobiales bacterium]
MSSLIPVVDLDGLASGAPEALGRIAGDIGRAAREVGFFCVVGHGVDPALRAAVFAAADALFAWPAAQKAEIALARVGDNRGWIGLNVEALDPNARPDPKEAFNIGFDPPGGPTRNVWPDLAGFRATMEAWFDAVFRLGRDLHRAIAVDLGAPADHFADAFHTPMATLRLLHYPPVTDTGVDGLGAGAHTDYGNLTLLATDDVGGLEVRRRDGVWITPPFVADAFVVNIGDCLMRWSNDVYLSNPHRVVAPRDRIRRSVAFFLDPSPDVVVEALPSCVPPGETPRHPPITAGDHLAARLAATYAAPSP